MTKQIELKPCPFTGDKGKIGQYGGYPYMYRVFSDRVGTGYYETKDAAIKAWNTRTPEAYQASAWIDISEAPRNIPIIAAYFYETSEFPYNLYKTYWHGDEWIATNSNGEFMWEPTHFIPLPQPPQPEGEE